jgi:hypothetical protein
VGNPASNSLNAERAFIKASNKLEQHDKLNVNKFNATRSGEKLAGTKSQATKQLRRATVFSPALSCLRLFWQV